MNIYIVILLILQVLDGATTYYGITKAGAQELNPAVKWVMDKIGLVPAIALMKAAVCLVLFLIVLPPWMYWCLIALYVAVVGNNVYQIKSRL